MQNETFYHCYRLFWIAAVLPLALLCGGCGAAYRSPALQNEIDGLKLSARQLADENEGLRGRLSEIQSAGAELADGAYAISQSAGGDIETVRNANRYFEAEFERLYKILRGGNNAAKGKPDMVETINADNGGPGGVAGDKETAAIVAR
jgi:hypothetical protein